MALTPQQQQNLDRLLGLQASGAQLGQNQQNNLARLLGMQGQTNMPTLGGGGGLPYVPPQGPGPGSGFTNWMPTYGGGQSAMPTLPAPSGGFGYGMPPNTLAALFGGGGLSNMPAQVGGGMANMPAQQNSGMWSGPAALQSGAWRPDMSQGGGTSLMTVMGGGMPYVSAGGGWQGGLGGQGFSGGFSGTGQRRQKQFQGFNQPRMPTL